MDGEHREINEMHIFLFILSWALCAFGQPAVSPTLSILASLVGYALIFYVISQLDSKKRFWLGTFWFAAVLAVQLIWVLSHPFFYIYIVYGLALAIFGAQFGLLCLWITPNNIRSWTTVMAISGFWVIMEWLRLFIFSGITWNPVGLALAGSVYSLQMAALFGVYGMSFWVIFTALLWLRKSYKAWFVFAILPFLFGWIHIQYHEKKLEGAPRMRALLVQTSFPIEETMNFHQQSSFLDFVLDEWRRIFKIVAEHEGEKFDLIALPEAVVPLGTYSFAYPYAMALELINENFKTNEELLPDLRSPYADNLLVNNAFFSQAISNIFNSPLIIGLEDADWLPDGDRVIYSSAVYFTPNNDYQGRYEKRVLLPMGEYIPWKFLADIARSYGIAGSFSPGEQAKVFRCGEFSITPSICYEETFGALTCEGVSKGAQIIVNLTSDVWYPHSLLVRQHLEHSRLRSVEGGVPLIRSCNTGITCAIDSLGRTVDELGKDAKDPEDVIGALAVTVPMYQYKTLYSIWGDLFIVCLSLLACFGYLFINKKLF